MNHLASTWLCCLCGLLLLLLGVGPAAAQQFPADPLNPNQPLNPAAPLRPVRPDTATLRPVSKKEKRAQAAADSARRTERLFGLRVTRPQKAGLLALVPGAGQLYNRRYWKVPIAAGGMAGLGYWWIFQQRAFWEYKNAIDLVTVNGLPVGSPKLGDRAKRETSLVNLNNGLNFYRTNRDLVVLFTALGYGLQILDAVVDAHLRDFDVGDNLSGTWQPALLPVPGQAALAPGFVVALRIK